MGGFEAADQGGFSIVPEAFEGRFPCQVRFTVNDQQQAPISESQFEGVLGSNYYDCKRFTFRLNREQVWNMLNTVPGCSLYLLPFLLRCFLGFMLDILKRQVQLLEFHVSPGVQVDQLDTILSWQSGHYQGSEDFTGNEMVGGGFSGKLQIERAGNVVDAHPSLDSGLQSLQKASSRVVAAHKLSLLNLKALFSPSQSTFPINREELELGGDQRTTIYLGPFPGGSSYSASRILDLLNKNNRGKYNFMFVEHGHNDYRHCFLNMERPEYILSLMDELHSRDWHSLLGRSRREAFIIKVQSETLFGIAHKYTTLSMFNSILEW